MIMRKLVTLVVGACLLFGLALVAVAKEKGKKATKQERISGTIHMINKDTSTLTVRTRSNVQREVIYNDQTKFTKKNAAGGSVADLKEGTRVICLGKFESGPKLTAERIDIR